jgi:8-oxo-dGTP diphosphatase
VVLEKNSNIAMASCNQGSFVLDVAVGVIIDQQQQVLLTLRNSQQRHAYTWEFPGGKFELEETPRQALRRELAEELAIEVQAAQFFLLVKHDYDYGEVRLHVFLVTEYQGVVQGNEGQQWQWCAIPALSALAMPAANQTIVQALLKLSRQPADKDFINVE